MLARKNERFGVLHSRGGRHDRQATLRAAFDWSWDLLHDAEKAALAQLSVFVDGFSLASAEAEIVPPAGTTKAPHDALDLVHGLVDKSLVSRSGEDRFDLLQSVRAYAAEHLRTAGRYPGSGAAAAAAAAQRHAAHFASLEPGDAIAGGCIELENLAAACRCAVAVGDGELASNALRGAAKAFVLRGPFRELVMLTEAVRAMPGLAGRARVEVELDTALAHLLCGSHAQARGGSARAAPRPGHSTGWRTSHRAPVRSRLPPRSSRPRSPLSTTADPDLRCTVLSALAEFEGLRGHGETARHHYQEALCIAREGGARRWEGGLAGNLGTWHADWGQPAKARELYGVAITIARELGDRQWEANTRSNLGLLLFERGDLADAERELDAAHEAARELGHARLVAFVRCNFGLLAEAQGEPAAAEAHQRAALGVARELGDRRIEGQVLGYLGLLEAQRGGLRRRACRPGGCRGAARCARRPAQLGRRAVPSRPRRSARRAPCDCGRPDHARRGSGTRDARPQPRVGVRPRAAARACGHRPGDQGNFVQLTVTGPVDCARVCEFTIFGSQLHTTAGLFLSTNLIV